VLRFVRQVLLLLLVNVRKVECPFADSPSSSGRARKAHLALALQDKDKVALVSDRARVEAAILLAVVPCIRLAPAPADLVRWVVPALLVRACLRLRVDVPQDAELRLAVPDSSMFRVG
jgi:hypothetical protein